MQPCLRRVRFSPASWRFVKEPFPQRVGCGSYLGCLTSGSETSRRFVPVAQSEEQWISNPQRACSIHAGDASWDRRSMDRPLGYEPSNEGSIPSGPASVFIVKWISRFPPKEVLEVRVLLKTLCSIPPLMGERCLSYGRSCVVRFHQEGLARRIGEEVSVTRGFSADRKRVGSITKRGEVSGR